MPIASNGICAALAFILPLASRRAWSVTGAILLSFLVGTAYADVQYVYDNAGRLVQVIAADGSSARYQYDAGGNITAINRLTAGQLAITAFSPNRGPEGAVVTIWGSGFSTTPAQNAVTFNGTTAAVTAATDNKLTVTVRLARVVVQ